MPLSGKDSLNFLFMVGSTVLIGHGGLARHATTEADGYMRLHPLFMGLAFALMISLGFWMYNYEDLPGEWIDTRSSRRKIHGFCQATGTALAVAGTEGKLPLGRRATVIYGGPWWLGSYLRGLRVFGGPADPGGGRHFEVPHPGGSAAW
eukprot:Skav202652  [mRNA]  locus=scaffold1228:38863:40115:+ [translate_table: standard]